MIMCPVCLDNIESKSPHNPDAFDIDLRGIRIIKKDHHVFRHFCDANNNIIEYFLDIRSPKFNVYVETYFAYDITVITFNNDLPYKIKSIDPCDILSILIKFIRLQAFK